jgi:hypothetical protein
MVGGLVGILIVGLVVKPAPELQPGRYALMQSPSGSGIYRLDTATGRVDAILLRDGQLQEIEIASAQVPPKLSSAR